MRDYVAIANQYIDDVLAARIPACKWVRLACERQRRDLARAEANDPAFPYVFNPELVRTRGHRAGKAYRPAVSICAFVELMPHVSGDWAARGERIRLEPWQCFFLTTVFGWMCKQPDRHPTTLGDGRVVHRRLRRFRKADLYVPRKNAKSTLAAGIGNYMLAADEEFGAEVYAGATSLEQATKVFGPAKQMSAASPDYRAAFGVIVNAASIVVPDVNSKFQAVIGKPGDGASPSCSITDEYHEHATSEQYDTMVTGMGARSQPLALVITTAGSNIGGPAYAHQREGEKILDGLARDERRFVIIFGIDAADDWQSPASLAKANPNYGVSVNADSLLAELEIAKNDARKSSVFRTKHLNVWVGASNPWLNVASLQRACDPTLDAADFHGEECYLGLDLASKVDLASKAKVFKRVIDDEDHYFAFVRSYAPEAAVRLAQNEHYRGYVAAGELVQTPGNMIDLECIQDDVFADADMHLIAEVGMDQYGGIAIGPAMQNEGLTVIDVPQRVSHLSEPMKHIAALVDAGRFHLAAAPDGATAWMFSNVEVAPDRNENIFPRKAKPELKIDAAVATIIAMARALRASEPKVDMDAFLATPAFL